VKPRILHIEDMPSDAYLIRREVKRVLGPCDFRIVEDQSSFLTALQDFVPDLILSDVSVPGFDWRGAMNIRKKHAPATPFIVVTGAENEAIRKECTEAGADGYVNKNNIRELDSILRTALHLDQSDPSS